MDVGESAPTTARMRRIFSDKGMCPAQQQHWTILALLLRRSLGTGKMLAALLPPYASKGISFDVGGADMQRTEGLQDERQSTLGCWAMAENEDCKRGDVFRTKEYKEMGLCSAAESTSDHVAPVLY